MISGINKILSMVRVYNNLGTIEERYLDTSSPREDSLGKDYSGYYTLLIGI